MTLLTRLLVILGFLASTAACSTMEGVGEDISAAGSALSKSASSNKGY